MKILTKDAYLNDTNSYSGSEEPYVKINRKQYIGVRAKNLDVEMSWNKKKLK